MNSKQLAEQLKEFNTLKKRFRESLKEPSLASTDGATVDPKMKAIQPLVSEINKWIRKSVGIGAYLYSNSDRRVLQVKINEWVLLLERYGHVVPDSTLEQPNTSAGFPLDVACPYPGLKAYTESYELIGRDTEVADYCEHLATNNFLSIVGGSGTGKSSIVLAGVVPRLRKIDPYSTPNWLFIPTVVPGANPVESLTDCLLKALEETESKTWISLLVQIMESDGSGLVDHLQHRSRLAKFIIVVDQFEEMFSVCKHQDERELFSQLLIKFVCSGNKVITTTRTDHLALFENTLPRLFVHMTLPNERRPGPLSFQQLKNVVEIPAQKVGLRFVPPTLVDERLAGPTARLFGGLPMLQYALRQLWSKRPTENGVPLDFINENSFVALPDVETALAHAAGSLYDSLEDDLSREICKRALLELVVLADFDEPLRRRRLESELVIVLTSLFSQSAENPETVETQIKGIIDLWVDADLWVRSGENETQIEVAHEALLRFWPEFLVWLNKAKEDLTQRKIVDREVSEWSDGGRSRDLLKLKGEALSKAVRLDQELWFDSASSEYIVKCVDEENRVKELSERAEASDNAKRKLQKNATRNKIVAAGLIAAMVVVNLFWYQIQVNLYQKKENQRERVNTVLAELQSTVTSFEFNKVATTLNAVNSDFKQWSIESAQELPSLTRVFDDSDELGFSDDGAILTRHTGNGSVDDPSTLESIYLEKLDSAYPLINFQGILEDSAQLIKTFTSAVDVNNNKTSVLVFHLPSEETNSTELANESSAKAKSKFGIVLLRQDLGQKDEVTTVSIQDLIELQVDTIGDISFNADGTRVLVLTHTNKDSGPPGPPIVSLNDFEYLENGGTWVREQTRFGVGESLSNLGCGVIDQTSTLASAVLSGSHKCPAMFMSNRMFFCPGSSIGYKIPTILRPPSFYSLSTGIDNTFHLSSGDSLFAWTCDADTVSPALLAVGSIASVSSARIGMDDQLHVVATVDGEIRCWYREQDQWNTRYCFPGTRADAATLSQMGDKLKVRLIPDYGETNTKAYLEMPYTFRETDVQTVLKDIPKDDFIAHAGMSVVRYKSPTPYQQPFDGAPNVREQKVSTEENRLTLFNLVAQNDSNGVTELELNDSDDSALMAVSWDGNWVGMSYTDSPNSLQNIRFIPRSDRQIVPPPIGPLDQGNDTNRIAISTSDGQPDKIFYSNGRQVKGWQYADMDWKTISQQFPEEPAAISCLAVSQNGEFLAIGMHEGKGRVQGIGDDVKQSTTRSQEDRDNLANTVHCAVSNSGFAVFGLANGHLMWGGEGEDLKIRTDVAGQSVTVGIKQINIDEDGNHAVVLSDWHHYDCGLKGMPGQSIWLLSFQASADEDVKNRDAEFLKKCVPNTSIQAVSPAFEKNEKISGTSVSYLSNGDILNLNFTEAAAGGGTGNKDKSPITIEKMASRYGIIIDGDKITAAVSVSD